MKQPSLLTFIAVLASLIFIGSEARAQKDLPRYEIGGQFSLLSLNGPSSQDSLGLSKYFDNPCKQFDLVCKRTAPGLGARFTYNLKKSLALEAEGNYFPGRPLASISGAFSPGGIPAGHIYQCQFGVKVGKRSSKVGFFLKFRPGFVGFTQTSEFTGFKLKAFFDPSHGTTVQLENPEFQIGKATYPSIDVGVVVEFYPSRRIVTRLDVGDTIIRYGVYREPLAAVCPLCCPCPTQIFERPAETRHNLQFSAGIGVKF